MPWSLSLHQHPHGECQAGEVPPCCMPGANPATLAQAILDAPAWSHLAEQLWGSTASKGMPRWHCRYQQKLQQPARQMPPLPAFLSNLTAQQPAAASKAYAFAGSPAQYLQPRQPQAAVTTPQLPVITGQSGLHSPNLTRTLRCCCMRK